MDWSGAKNWLIALFAGLNIFLIVMLISISTNSAKLDRQIIDDTVKILENNSILIDSSIIPDKIPKLNSVEVTNAITDKDLFASLLLGSNYEKSENKYTFGTKTLHFSQSKFFYYDTSPNENYNDLTEANASVKVSAFLNNLNLSTESADYKTAYKNDIYTVELSQNLDKYPLFDSNLKVELSKNGISSIVGSWFYVSEDQSSVKTAATRVSPATAVLIDFISNESRISNKSDKITDITIGYTSGETAEFQSFAAAIPVWRIKTSDGHCYYFDAR